MAKHKVEIVGVNTSNLKVLSNKETLRLLKEYSINKNELLKQDIILGNLKLVLSSIKGFSLRSDNQDDLFQIGCIGLIKAIDNFNIDYNLQFSTYAVPMIVGEIKRYLRDNTPVRVSRQIKDLAYKSLKIKEDYLKENHKDISEVELAKKLNVSLKDLKLALDSTCGVTSLYESVYKDESDEILLIDKIVDEDYSNEKLINLLTLKQAYSFLNNIEKKIISDRYYLGKTQFEIAKEFNISQAQVSRIEKSAINNIKSFFY